MATHFADSYQDTRRRFLDAADSAGASVISYPISVDCDEELAIDVASVGPDDAPTVVTSSAVHGVEGFFGSAIQHAYLQQLPQKAAGDTRHVLIHGVNPYGFSQLRRFNEDNVDLNRNFLNHADDYKGAPPGYAELNGFLNPESPPSAFEPYKLKALWNIRRYGQQALKQAVAGGQYEYPKGLFFGGKGPCESTEVFRDHCDAWIGATQKVVHIDFHSGLGEFGRYVLLLNESPDSPGFEWYANAFGVETLAPLHPPGGADTTAYEASGPLGDWVQQRFSSIDYRFVAAEFGTYPIPRVLGAIRAENRAHHYAAPDSRIFQKAKAELLECFCPAEMSWRQQVLESGLNIIAQATAAVSDT